MVMQIKLVVVVVVAHSLVTAIGVAVLSDSQIATKVSCELTF